VGLPAGPRRRTPGLRREEVAQLAGLGVSWYTWLEQGRPINASEQVLEAIARTLRLDRAERDHLFQLAGAPAAGADESHDFPLSREVQTILDALAALPAALYSARCDVVMHNAAFGAMFPDLLRDPASRRNALWSLFAAPGSCDQVTDRHLELPQMAAMLRANYGRHVGAPVWEQFIRELSSASPEFAEMWRRHDVADAEAARITVFRHSSVGEIRVTTNYLAVTGAPEHRMIIFTPTDQESADRIGQLMTHPDAPAG
jgi:transcriptional regulator with XRE-family HTH domain